MSGTPYGTGDVWPHAKKPWWRPVLDLAREYGWNLNYLDAPHTYGWVSCPAGSHLFKVDQTANGAETKAIEARKMIERKCQHGMKQTPDKVADRARRAAKLLDSAERTLDVAEMLLLEAETFTGSWAIVTDLEGHVERLRLQLATAMTTVAAALDSTEAETDMVDGEDLEIELERARQLLDAEFELAASLDEPDVSSVAHSLEQAHGHLSDAEILATELRRRPAKADPIRDRAAQLGSRISGLEIRLIPLQERNGTADG